MAVAVNSGTQAVFSVLDTMISTIEMIVFEAGTNKSGKEARRFETEMIISVGETTVSGVDLIVFGTETVIA